MLTTRPDLLLAEENQSAVACLREALSTSAFDAYGTKACKVMSPAVIDQEALSHIGNAAVALSRALSALARHLIVQDDFQNLFGLDDKTAAIVLRSPIVVDEFAARCDAFVNEQGEIQFIEFNCSTPGGMFFNDLLEAVFTPIVDQLYGPGVLTPVPAATHYIRALAACIAEAAFLKTPRLCIVVPSGLMGEATRRSPELRNLQQRLQDIAIDCIVVGDSDVHVEGEYLFTPFGRVDIVLVLNWASAIASYSVEHALFNPGLSPRTLFLNPVSSCVTRGNKILFAYLYDQRFSEASSQASHDAVRRFIPPTYRLTDTITTPDGAPVSALTFARNHRRNHVVKKANSLGGKDVYLGWQYGQEEWESLLDGLRPPEYIVQQRVVGSVLGQAAFDDQGVLTPCTLHYDLCPFVWNNAYSAGAYVRLGGTGLMNMSAGEVSAVPLYAA